MYKIDFGIEPDSPDRPEGLRDLKPNTPEGPDQWGSPRAPLEGATTLWRGSATFFHIVVLGLRGKSISAEPHALIAIVRLA